MAAIEVWERGAVRVAAVGFTDWGLSVQPDRDPQEIGAAVMAYAERIERDRSREVGAPPAMGLD